MEMLFSSSVLSLPVFAFPSSATPGSHVVVIDLRGAPLTSTTYSRIPDALGASPQDSSTRDKGS
jgi:hypothetical protein